MSSTGPQGADVLAAGRAALAAADWAEALARFGEATRLSEGPEAWEGLSRAAWWLGEQEQTMAARERAYRSYRRAGDVRGAARMAMWVGSDHLDFHGDDAVATAWIRQGKELLGDLEPCAEMGYLLLLDADVALLSRSDPGAAVVLASQAIELARGIGDTGVEVVGLAVLGSALVASGDLELGVRRLEECVALAVGEDFVEVAAPGWALCHTVSACADIGDFARAEQWCRALHGWSTLWRARHFFGICRTAYGEVLVTSGDWPSAEEELLHALDDLRTTRPALAAPTAIRLGRLRARQGDRVAARELFETALPLPQAVAALGSLDLADGDAAAASDAAERVLRRGPGLSVFDRFPALELLATARAAAGDRGGADAATAELEREAARLSTPYMRGRVSMVHARVSTAAGEHDAARRCAEDAIDLFTTVAAPYEAAEARMLLSDALKAMGRHGRAEAEARAARAAFDLLGTKGGGRGRGGPLSPRETDILRLVAQDLGDAAIAQRLFLSPHTVHRHIANIRTKLGVSSRAAAVAHASRAGML